MNLDGAVIDSSVIGGTTAAAGTFTTLTANTSITGTLATAAQTNITSVGTLTSLTVSGDATFDTSTLKVDSTNNRVGIGTASPATKFDVITGSTGGFKLDDEATAGGVKITTYQGSTNSNVRNINFDVQNFIVSTGAPSGTSVSEALRVDSSGHLYVGAGNVTGSAASPLIQINDVDTGIFDGGTNIIGFSTGGTERMRIDGSGNVGIGTVPAAWGGTSQALQIDNTSLEGRSNLSDFGMFVTNAYNHDGSNYKYISSNYASNYYQYQGEHIFETAASGTADAAVSWSERMRIDNSGNVGIGTTSPTEALSIVSSDGLVSATSTTAKTAGVLSGGYVIYSGDGSGPGAGNRAGIQSYATNGVGSQYDLRFYTSDGVTNFNEAMRIDSTGNLGLGTSSPKDLSGQNSLSINGSVARIDFKIADTFRHAIVTEAQYLDISVDPDNSQSSSRFSVSVDNSERMRIDSSGRLLVGATSGNQRLLVSDDANDNTVLKVRNSGNSTPYGQVIEFSGAAPDDNTRYFLRCGDTGANRMHIYSDGDVNTSDAGTLTSDRSLKTDIADATSKLADVNQLQVRNFKWITDYHPNKQNKHIGFIADEFETVFPSLVVEHENPIVGQDGTVKSVRYGALIPILVKALQEADDKIDALEARITALES